MRGVNVKTMIEVSKTIQFTSDKLKIVSCHHIIEFFATVHWCTQHIRRSIFNLYSINVLCHDLISFAIRYRQYEQTKTHRSTRRETSDVSFYLHSMDEFKSIKMLNNVKNQTKKQNAIQPIYWTHFIGKKTGNRQQGTWQVL